MQLSTLASKANLSIPTSLTSVDDVTYHVVDYSLLDGRSNIESIINPNEHWDMGCTITPHGQGSYFVSLSVFQGIKHYPVVTIQVAGSFSDAAKVYQVCENYISNVVIH